MDVSQSLKRLQGFRDYWLNIPPGHVDLATVGGENLHLEGLDNLRNCYSVGCLAGWLTTMPEFRQWHWATYRGKYPYSHDTIPNCYRYLFPGTMELSGLFAGRQPRDTRTDWEIGLSRLDTRITLIRKDMIP